MIAGLAHPTSGEILLAGRPIRPLPPYKRDIGMVFQNYALFPHMTVARNIAFPLEMRDMPRAEIRRRVEMRPQAGRSAGIGRSLSASALGRTAAARCACARHCVRAEAPADG